MIRVIAKFFLKPDKIQEAAPILRELIAATRKEAGCVEYGVFFESKQPVNHVFIETWKSQEALNEHAASKHFKDGFAKLNPMFEKPLEIQVLEELAP